MQPVDEFRPVDYPDVTPVVALSPIFQPVCLLVGLPGMWPITASRKRRYKDEYRLCSDFLRRRGYTVRVIRCRLVSGGYAGADVPKRAPIRHERIKREVDIKNTVWSRLPNAVTQWKATVLRPWR